MHDAAIRSVGNTEVEPRPIGWSLVVIIELYLVAHGRPRPQRITSDNESANSFLKFEYLSSRVIITIPAIRMFFLVVPGPEAVLFARPPMEYHNSWRCLIFWKEDRGVGRAGSIVIPVRWLRYGRFADEFMSCAVCLLACFRAVADVFAGSAALGGGATAHAALDS